MAKKPKKKTTSNTSPGAQTANANIPTPIGVEPGYTATIPMNNLPVDPLWAAIGQKPPQTSYQRSALPMTAQNPYGTYNQGDEWSPAGSDPDQIIELQTAMEAAGFYTGSYTKGVWTATDAAAYAKVLATANGSGVSDKVALQRLVANPQTDPTGASKRAPLVVRLSNTADINQLVDSFGANLYGGKVPDATKQAIVDAIHNSESQYQQSAYDMGNDAGGTVMQPADAQTVAEQTIKAQHPNEVAATQFADSFDAILQSFTTNKSGYQLSNYP